MATPRRQCRAMRLAHGAFGLMNPESEVNMKSIVVRAVTTGAVGAVLFFSMLSPVQAFDGRTDLLKLNSGNFSHPLKIDNKWRPLKPGTQLVFTGMKIDEEDHEQPYELVITVTDLVKEIQGIESAAG